jgi:hypothetical protein
MRIRFIAAFACLAVTVAACGEEGLTVAEYAAEVEELVADMVARFEAIDDEWQSQTPTAEGADEYWTQRLAIRADFLDGVRNLDPPDEVADMHAAAIDIFSRITAADEALASRVATFETVTDHWQWVDTPEGRAADAVLEEVYAFCRASQADFDATVEREALEGNEWIPSELTQTVSVAFGCPPP